MRVIDSLKFSYEYSSYIVELNISCHSWEMSLTVSHMYKLIALYKSIRNATAEECRVCLNVIKIALVKYNQNVYIKN